MFRNAIVRVPCRSIINGLTSSNLGKPDYRAAMYQHTKYVDTLRIIGLNVKILDGDEKHPDSTFIEDVALCTPECAIITSPGAVSRRDEIAGMRQVLEEFYTNVDEIRLPGTLEAGDVMMAGNHFYIGISRRTNIEGAEQLIRILKRYGMTGSKVPLEKILHLKSGVSYLEKNNLLVSGEFIMNKEFARFNRIEIDEEESYAANSLWINGRVLVPAGFPKARKKIEDQGYETIILNVSEFQKIDGGLSCLSLRF